MKSAKFTFDQTNTTPTVCVAGNSPYTQITVWGNVTTVTANASAADGAPMEPVIDGATGDPLLLSGGKLTFRIAENMVNAIQLTTDATGEYYVAVNQWG